MDKFLQGLTKVVGTIVNLRFLPEQIQRWLFSTGTRALEVANIAVMMGWAAFLYLDGDRMLVLTPYKSFSLLGHELLASLFVAFSAVILAGIFYPSRRGLLFKGYTMLLSGAVWAIVSTGFVISYPPLTTAMIVYPVLAILCWLCGENLIERSSTDT